MADTASSRLPSQRSTRGRVLVVDDEPLTADIVRRYLEEAGYETSVDGDGLGALARVAAWRPDLLVLDVMLPRLGGLEVLRRLQSAQGRRVLVILLSAVTGADDRIRGLNVGADDYVSKPFSAAELVARVDAVLRPAGADDDAATSPLVFDALEIDPLARVVRLGSRTVTLAQREFDLLLFMASRPGQVFTREQLMDAVWRFQYYSDTSTVTVHIRRLRAKMERDPSQPARIETSGASAIGSGPETRPQRTGAAGSLRRPRRSPAGSPAAGSDARRPRSPARTGRSRPGARVGGGGGRDILWHEAESAQRALKAPHARGSVIRRVAGAGAQASS